MYFIGTLQHVDLTLPIKQIQHLLIFVKFKNKEYVPLTQYY